MSKIRSAAANAAASPSVPAQRHCSEIAASVCAALALMTLLVAARPGSAATLGRPWVLEQSVESAALVFEGTVTEIAFRDSEPVADTGVTLPHMFITYRIDNVLRGRSQSRQLTLRFLGGWSDKSGRIMRVTHAPLFKLGDRDILFVAGNGAAACPLVACGLGRFRIFEDAVYTNTGLAIRLDAAGSLRIGPDRLPAAKTTMTFPPAPPERLRAVEAQIRDQSLSEKERETLRRRLRDMSGPRVLGLGRVVGEPPTPPSTPPLSAERFKTLIVGISDRFPGDAVPVASASPDEPFEYPPMVLRPAEPPTRVPAPRQLTREQQRLQQNNGNPVLRRQQ
jgi:hypothetical protein